MAAESKCNGMGIIRDLNDLYDHCILKSEILGILFR